jgi:hypothetical protein
MMIFKVVYGSPDYTIKVKNGPDPIDPGFRIPANGAIDTT